MQPAKDLQRLLLTDERLIAVFLSATLCGLIELGHDVGDLRKALEYALAVQFAIRDDCAKDDFVRQVEKPVLREERLVQAFGKTLAALEAAGGLKALLGVYSFYGSEEIWDEIRSFALNRRRVA